MIDHLGSDLDELFTQRSQRPFLQRLSQQFFDDGERTLWAKSFIVTKGRRLKLGERHPHTAVVEQLNPPSTKPGTS